jgi:hypothetical protein
VFSHCRCPIAGATFDAFLRLRDPSCVVVSSNDDTCGRLPEIVYTATVTGRHVLEVTGSTPSDHGAFTLCHFRLGAPCPSCIEPTAVLPLPGLSCRCADGDTTLACPSRHHAVSLSAGITYVFTPCSATCPDARAGYDTALRVFDPRCRLVATNDDACGMPAELVFRPTVSGEHVVEVTGVQPWHVGRYTLCTRVLSVPCPTCGEHPRRRR